MTSRAPFVINEALLPITLAYRNQSYIADAVLPRIPVGAAEFKWDKWDKAEGFTIPNTRVGRTSAPNRVEFNATEVTSSTDDYGLDDPVPNSDIQNAQGTNLDPLGRATETLTDLVLLDREKRVADLVFAAATYDSGLKTTLSGTSQWSDYTNSNPLTAIMAALDLPLLRPNVAIFGRPTFTKLAMHPAIVKAIHGTSGDSGVATRQQIAALLELEEVLVGESWYNSAKKGQTASYGRLWGKHAAFIYRKRAARIQKDVTFGATAQFGARVAGTIPDPNIGLRGGQIVRVGESVKEIIMASDVGYFFENAVA